MWLQVSAPWNAAPENPELVALPPWDFQLTAEHLSQERVTLRGKVHLAVVSKPKSQK